MKKRLLFLLLLCLVSNHIEAQIGFQESVVVDFSYSITRPAMAKSADIDCDGDIDVVAVGGGINWFENIDGTGSFSNKNAISDNSSVKSMHLADFDNDGDTDVLSVTNNSFELLKNTNCSGIFESFVTITPNNPSGTVPVFPVDFDGDGDMDVVSYYRSYSPNVRRLIWYENTDGNGNFSTEQIISEDTSSIDNTSIIYIDDIDGDNNQDIILGSHNLDKIVWLKNLTNGSFSAATTITNTTDGVVAIYASDIDNDGDKDIIAASQVDNEVNWYENQDGLGSFSAANNVTTNATEVKAIYIADVNNDNNKDILVASSVNNSGSTPADNNKIAWFSNANGDGTFGSEQIISTKAIGANFVTVADIDGDNNQDVISSSRDDDKVAWYNNVNGDGTFGRETIISRRIQYPNNVYHGDFDGDGDIDILATSQHDAKLAWFENVNGLGFYGKQYIITEDAGTGNQVPKAYPVDIDGDGDLDIAFAHYTKLAWLENVDGKGNFTTEHLINDSGTGATIIRSGDFDDDGDMDLVFGVYNSNKLFWHENTDGNGTFGTEQVIYDSGGNNGSLTSLEVADLDEDNDLDIIASSFNTNMFLYKNSNGLGDFQSEHFSVFSRKQAVYPTDVDGDGDNDIVAVSSNGGGGFDAVVWYENSNGNFYSEHDISTLTIHGREIYAADIDNDGDIDVVTASGHSQTSGKLAWYENTDGNGNFADRQIIDEAFDFTRGQSVTIADVDNDNDVDIIAAFGYFANSYIGKVSVYENVGVLGNRIEGNVRIDTNADGCTNDDIAGSNLMVIADNGSNIFATFTDENGAYQIATTAGDFTTTITSQLPNHFTANPTSHMFNFTGLGNQYTGDFCIEPVGAINDLNVSVYPTSGAPRPGFDTRYRIVYNNNGTTQLSGNITFEFDNTKMQFVTASETLSAQTSNTLTFDYSALNPLESGIIDLEFTLFALPTTNIDDELTTTVTINPVSGDDTQEDNIFELEQLVIGSYDPNDIQVLEGDKITIDEIDKYLHYIIRFQNTGTASAINVNVEHIFDAKLDWQTMQLESMSHTGSVEITNGDMVSFIFNNIHLPDSTTDEPNSHGFITFKIKPKNDAEVGDIINAEANIFFDFNPAIITNTVSTEIVEPLSVSEFHKNDIAIYPNPTKGLFTIRADREIEKLTIYDINGRQLKAVEVKDYLRQYQLNISNLSKGIYFVKIETTTGTQTQKLIKK